MDRIYLDANATTPILPEVLDAMLPFWTESFGNPSSAHQSGQRARSAVEQARRSVANLLNCSAKEIVFTSGGTESDNLALTGVLQPFVDKRQPAHLIITAIEHHAVLYTAQALQSRGIDVTCLAPQSDGTIDPGAFEAALRPQTELVSIMFANNETGAIQPVGKLARIAKAYNPSILVHTDAVQAAAKLPIDLSGALRNIDLLSISGHKMYAPQGTGILFIRNGIHLVPLFHGGPHERQHRAGTENVPGIVALGRASELALTWLNSEAAQQLTALRDRLEQGLIAAIPETHVNGSTAPPTPLTFVSVRCQARPLASMQKPSSSHWTCRASLPASALPASPAPPNHRTSFSPWASPPPKPVRASASLFPASLPPTKSTEPSRSSPPPLHASAPCLKTNAAPYYGAAPCHIESLTNTTEY
jgi:cysteine desulfurase